MTGTESVVTWSILVVRTGGFAGIRREWRVNTADDASVDWPALIDACPWKKRYPASAARDRFVWRIEASAPPRVRRITLPESAVTGPWRELADHVKDAATG